MKIINILILLVVVASIYSCSDMNEFHDKYLEEGEIKYVAIPDTIIIMPGNKRIALKHIFKADKSITKAEVLWNGGTDSKEFDVTRTEADADTVTVVLNDMQEKNYTFGIYTYDEDGNQSIQHEVVGDVYGDNYRLGIYNRKAGSVSLTPPGILKILWEDAFEDDAGTYVSYKNSAGENVVVRVSNKDSEAIIKDFSANAEMSYQTYYKPVENAIDSFTQAKLLIDLPEGPDFMLDKGHYAALSLANDMAPQWNSLTNLWNGTKYTDGMANWGKAFPFVYSIDLGIASKLSRVVLSARESNKGPKEIEIWGINTDDIDAAATALKPSDAGWEQESIDKGWVKLFDGTAPELNENSDEEIRLDEIVADQQVRYVRFKIKGAYTGDVIALSELAFYWKP